MFKTKPPFRKFIFSQGANAMTLTITTLNLLPKLIITN